jgi:hypothetical protein
VPESGIRPLKQAVVKALRDNATLKAAISNEIHEGIAPRINGEPTPYPYCIYNIAWAVRDYAFGDEQFMRAGVDTWIVSDDQVEAHNLDALVITSLQDKSLDMGSSGQSPLYCRRISDRSEVDEDDAGSKVYLVGGTTEIWVTIP